MMKYEFLKISHINTFMISPQKPHHYILLIKFVCRKFAKLYILKIFLCNLIELDALNKKVSIHFSLGTIVYEQRTSGLSGVRGYPREWRVPRGCGVERSCGGGCWAAVRLESVVLGVATWVSYPT